MPIVTVQESEGRTPEQRQQALTGITDAIADAYGLPPESVTVFFATYTEDEWGKAGVLGGRRA